MLGRAPVVGGGPGFVETGNVRGFSGTVQAPFGPTASGLSPGGNGFPGVGNGTGMRNGFTGTLNGSVNGFGGTVDGSVNGNGSGSVANGTVTGNLGFAP